MSHKKKAAIYVRVSSREQAEEGFSIQAQTERLKSYSSAKDYQVVKVFTDPGFSGANMERPALQEMIKEIENHTIDIVLVWKLDRLSRSQKNTLYLIEDVFLRNDVEFVSMQEAFDTTSPFGRAMIGILSVFAQLERDTITERSQLGKKQRAKNGLYNGVNSVPTGYRYNDGELFVDDYGSLVINQIFDWFLDGKGITWIARNIGSKYPMKRKLDSDTAISQILKNKVYCGYVGYKGEWFDGHHDSIISEEKYDKVQAIFAERNKTKSRAFTYTTLLGGMIYCGNCGARYFGKTSKTKYNIYRKYRCYSVSGYKNHMTNGECHNPAYDQEEADAYVIDEIKKLSIKEVISNREHKTLTDVSGLIDHRDKLERQVSNLIDLYQVDGIALDVLNERITKLNAEKASISNIISEKNAENAEISNEEITQIIVDAQKIDWENEELTVKRKAIKTLIEKVIFYEDSIAIHWIF